MNAPPLLPAVRRKRKWIIIGLVFVLICLVAGMVVMSGGIKLYRTAQAAAHQAVATELAKGIVQAVNSFYSDTGSLPIPPSTATEQYDGVFSTDAAEGKRILNTLGGFDRSLNTRGIKYITFRDARDRKDGVIYDPSRSTIEGLYDPWGNPYFIVLDINYDEKLTFTVAGKEIKLRQRRCAVYSAGADGMLGTSDDIKTWN